MHHRSVSVRPLLLVSLLAAIALALMSAAAVSLAQGRDGTTLTVTHGPVTITLANPASDGHQLGDLRVTSLPLTDESGAAVGRLDSKSATVVACTTAASVRSSARPRYSRAAMTEANGTIIRIGACCCHRVRPSRARKPMPPNN